MNIISIYCCLIIFNSCKWWWCKTWITAGSDTCTYNFTVCSWSDFTRIKYFCTVTSSCKIWSFIKVIVIYWKCSFQNRNWCKSSCYCYVSCRHYKCIICYLYSSITVFNFKCWHFVVSCKSRNYCYSLTDCCSCCISITHFNCDWVTVFCNCVVCNRVVNSLKCNFNCNITCQSRSCNSIFTFISCNSCITVCYIFSCC